MALYEIKDGVGIIPEGTTVIKSHAFEGCTELKSIVIPSSVTEIESFVFKGCTGLESFVLPSSVTKIGVDAFFGCSGLKSIAVEEGNEAFDSRENCNAIINKDFNEIAVGCENTVVPPSVTSIGRSSFAGCTGLKSIELHEGITGLEIDAFNGCTGLTSIVIPSTVKKLKLCAFEGCSGLESIVVADANPMFDSRGNCNAIIKVKTDFLVEGCKNTIIPQSVVTICSYAFTGKGLTSIVIPEGVTNIEDTAFRGCPELESIVIEEGNKVYDSRENSNAIIDTKSNTLLLGCKGTVIPSTVKTIGESAFVGCTGLTSIEIPEGVATISEYAFQDCAELTEVILQAGIKKIGECAFDGCANLACIKVPAKKADYYKKRLPEELHSLIVEMEPVKKK